MSNTTTVSFPGLGIEPFDLGKIAFSVGKIEVRWYGIIITSGILLAFLYAIFRGKRNEKVLSDDIIDVGLLTVALGILGARLYYVLTTLDIYEYNSFMDVIAIWNGGLAIYGGIIGGCIGILVMCRIKKLSWLKLFDMIGPGVMIAQALGRWGNFFNGEAHGYAIGETTRFYFFNNEHIINSGEGTLFHTLRMGLSSNGTDPIWFYHPTFLYESVWNILGFVLINLFYKHKKFDGQIALMYFTWYGFGRMFIEGLRTDSLFLPGTTLRISQCLGLFFFAVGLILLITFSLLQAKRKKEAAMAAAFAAASAPHSEQEFETVSTDASTEDMTETNNTETENKELENTEDNEHGKID